MKALSVKQPFANLILGGKKPIETRTWGTSYRGDLLICASKKPHDGQVFIPSYGHSNDAPLGQWMNSKLALSLYPGLEFYGVAICIARLSDCKPFQPHEVYDACCGYYPDAFGWHLDNIRPVENVPVRGQLGLFEVPDEFISQIFKFEKP